MNRGSLELNGDALPTTLNTNPTNLDLYNIIKELVSKVNSLENQVSDLKNQLSTNNGNSGIISTSNNSNSNNNNSNSHNNNNSNSHNNSETKKKKEKKTKKVDEKKDEKKKKTKKMEKKDEKNKVEVNIVLPQTSSIEIPSMVLEDLTSPIEEETCEVSLQTQTNFVEIFGDEMSDETLKENEMDDCIELSDEDPERIEQARDNDILKRKEDEECTNEDLMIISKDIPPFVLEKLYPHQKRGVKFLWDNIWKGNGCILADFMGMGKTLQTASFLHLFISQKQAKTALIVSPASVNTHWIREFDRIEKWLSDPDGFFIKPVLLSSKSSVQDRKKISKNWHEKGGVMVTSYDMFRTLCVDDDFKEFLINPGPDIIILDEGHKIRHLSSKITRALNSVNTPKRIILTGYPFQNNLLEYWTMINFVCPMYLGERNEFKRKYSKPIQKGQTSKLPYERRIARRRSWLLYEKVKSIILRRDASLLKKLLPHKQEILLTLSNSSIQKKMYKILIDTLKDTGKPSIFWTYDVVIMLCNHPDVLYNYYKWKEKQAQALKCEKDTNEKETESYSAEEETNNGELFDPSIDDEEIDSFIDKEVGDVEKDGRKDTEEIAKTILTEIFKNPENMGYKRGALDNGGKMILLFSVMFQCKSIGDRLIVFSRSINTLNFIENTLKRYNKDKDSKETLNFMRFDGSTPFDQRQSCIDKINDNSNNMTVLLISTLAGCEGINLMGANRVALIDVNWNPSHDSEAVCRVFRIGQTKPVYIYRFICENTMEDLVLKRQLQKENLSNWIVDNGNTSVDQYDTKNLLIVPTDDVLEEDPQIDPLIEDSIILNIVKENSKWIKRADYRDQLLRDDPHNILTEEEKLLAHSENEFESVYGSKRSYSKRPTDPNPRKPKQINAASTTTATRKPEEPINTHYLKNQESLWLRRQQILVEKETDEASKLLQILQTKDIPVVVPDRTAVSTPPSSSTPETKLSHSQFEKEKNNIMKQLVTKNKVNNNNTNDRHYHPPSNSTSFEDPYEIEMERNRTLSEYPKKRAYKDYYNNSRNRNNSHDSNRDRDYRDNRDNRDHNRRLNYDSNKRYKKY